MESEEENLLGGGPISGLGLFTAVVFLSGEMAGSGVLSLPSAMVGTGLTPSHPSISMGAYLLAHKLHRKLRLENRL
jgi:hypothetical protein